MANVELDTNATGLPPSIYGAWVLRGDQAVRLSRAVREDRSACSEQCATVMLVEARILGRCASVWVNVDDTAIDVHLHERGHELLAGLGASAENVPYLLADMRDLDEQGRPPQRSDACRCGSGRNAKNCVHHGSPRFFSTVWLFLHQEEWDRFVAHEDDFARPDMAMMGRQHARIGVRHHTLANKPLATLTRDFTAGHPPFLPWDLLTETASALSARVVEQMPFLREAQIWLTATRPGPTPPASYGLRAS